MGIILYSSCCCSVLNTLGYLGSITLFNLICTILLVPLILKSLFKLNFAGILFPLAILAIMYSDRLNINELTPYPVLLVALFGSIGLSLIFKPSHRSKLSKMAYDEIIDTKDDSKVNLKLAFVHVLNM